MNIKDYINFMKQEVPAHTEEICTALDLLITAMDNSKAAVDSQVAQCLSRLEYEKVNDYIEVSKGIAGLCSQLDEYLEELSKLTQEEEVVIEDDEDDYIESKQSEKVDYEKYRIDDSIAYNLYSNFTFKKPAAFVFEGKRYPVDKWKTLFTETCSLLWKKDSKLFSTFVENEEFNGRIRMYFSRDKKMLRKSVMIQNSNIYVETNMSANQFRNMIIKMLEKYGISRASYQIFLCKDYTELHNK